MADAKEWFVIEGISDEFSNLEAALEVARRKAAGSAAAFEICRMTRTPVRCVKHEVSITETDLTAAADI